MKKLKKYFWSDLANVDSIEVELQSLTLSNKEKEELLELAHVHLHQTIVDAILSHLTEVDKKSFLELLVAGEDEKIWDHLNSKVEKIEDKINEAAQKTKEELKSDIKKIK